MSANCGPVYNFYNCCCDDKAATGPNSAVSGFFIWSVDNALAPAPKGALDPVVSGGLAVFIDADK